MSDPAIIKAAARALACLPGNDELHRDLAIRVLAAVEPLIEAAALERAAKVAENFPVEVVQVYARGLKDPPGNLTRWSKPSDIAAAIRALKQEAGE